MRYLLTILAMLFACSVRADLTFGGGGALTSTAIAAAGGVTNGGNSMVFISQKTYSSFGLSGAGDTNVNGTWNIAGLTNAGYSPPNIFWTNNSPGYTLISNYVLGPYGYYIFSNGIVIYKHKNPLFSKNTGGWTVISGPSPAPNECFSVLQSVGNVIINPTPFIYDLQTNGNYISVETFGSDYSGSIMGKPYASLNGVFGNFFGSNIVVNVGAGTFTNNLNIIQIPDDCSIIGRGRFATCFWGSGPTIGGEPASGAQFSPIYYGNPGGIYLKDMAIGLFGDISNSGSFTNAILENLEIGTPNTVDCIYFNTAKGYGITNINCHFMSCWDANNGVCAEVNNNCVYDFSDISQITNTATGFHVAVLPSPIYPFSVTFNGGTVNMTANFPTNSYTQWISLQGQHCIVYLGFAGSTNPIVKINGLNFNHVATTSNVTFSAVYNPNGYTNVSGYYFDNGVLTYINGTNYTVFKSSGVTNFSSLNY